MHQVDNWSTDRTAKERKSFFTPLPRAQLQPFFPPVLLVRHHPRLSLFRKPPQETSRSRSPTSPLKRHARRCRPRTHLFCSPHRPPASPSQHDGNTAESISRFLDEQFYAAFGAPLLNKDGGPDSNDRKLWREIVGLSGKQYTLPGGRVGTRFINMLASEIESSTAGRQSSEREFLFTSPA